MHACTARIASALVFAAAVAAGPAQAQVNVGSASFSYAQNFDALTSTAWANNATLPGWFLYRQPAPGTAITTIALGDGSSGTGSFYSFASSGGSDKALGGAGSGGAYFGSPGTGSIAGRMAVAFTNASGGALGGFTVGFDGEQWRNGGNTSAQTMVLEYGFGASFAAVTNWVAPGGNFDWTSPVVGATGAAVDGNAAGRVAVRGGAIAATWAAGDTLWIRWVERNDAGNDHGLAIDNFSFSVGGGGGSAAIIPVCPATLAVATGAAGTASLTASDADGTVNSAAIASGGTSGISLVGFVAAPAAGGQAAVTLSVADSTAAGSYPVVVRFGNSDPQTADCTVNVTVAAAGAYTPIYNIQGSGSTSPLVNQIVTTRGVVTKVNNNGYFLQDETGDGNPLTSDGIFVFTPTAPTVSAGQRLQVTGTVTEFNTGATTNAVTAARPVTEISFVTATLQLGTGSVAPTVITLPLASADDMERYEGMLVQINTPLTASQNYFQGRYGQVTLSAGGRLLKPTNLYRPGTPQALDLAALNARNSLMLDDGTSAQNPNPTPYIGADNTLRAGDTLPTGIAGVIDYGLTTNDNTGAGMYRIHPTVAPVFTRSNPRTATPPALGGNVKVASFNVLNFFTTFTNGETVAGLTGQGCYLGGGTPVVDKTNCRGADTLAEFIRQRDKIVAAMAAINADVFGLMEIQNDSDVNKVNVAVQTLVDALNAVLGAGTYAVVPVPPTTGTDAIRVAMIYKPSTVALSGVSMSDANPIHNRPPFARTFSANGEKFSVVVNHFKSKGCSGAVGADADQGDGQGCFNDRRKQQAAALLTFIGTVKSAAADDDVLVIGDLNAYGKEDPVDALIGGGLVDQVSRFSSNGYSYVFDGEAGYLDHALASATMSAQVVGTADWHINADEPSIIDYNTEFKQPACGSCGPDYYSATPYRASDHDPVIIALGLGVVKQAQTISFPALPPQVAASAFTLLATASSGLPVSFITLTPAVCTVAGTLASMLAAGSCTIAADQAGNAQFLPAPQVQVTFTVNAAAQTITFTQPPNVAPGAPPFAADATASSGLTVTLLSQTPTVCTVSGLTVNVIAAGTCTLRAEQPGNAAYAAATPVTRSFVVQAGGGPGVNDGDVPLPPWALLLLGGGLAAALRRRRGGAHSRA